MKRILWCMCVISLLAVITGCNKEVKTEELTTITTPDEYCAKFDDADLLVGNDGNFYVEAIRVNWVVELDLEDTTPIAEVKRTGIVAEFEPWDATVLPVGTAIAQHNSEKNVIIADTDGKLIPYLLYGTE